MALQQTEHVAARLADRRHLRDDRQVVDDEADFVLLYLSEVVGVSEHAKAGDVGRAVRVVLVHEARRCRQRTQRDRRTTADPTATLAG